MLVFTLCLTYSLLKITLQTPNCDTSICRCHGESQICACYFHQAPYCEDYTPSVNCSVNPGCSQCNDSSLCLTCISTNQFVDDTQQCVDCTGNCSTCLSSLYCLTCVSDNYYLDSNQCLACVSPCLQCQSENQCVTCISDLYYLSNQSCIICQSPCLTCSSQISCLTCIDDTYFLDLSICQQCQSPCLTCIDNNTCLICITPFYQLSNGVCSYNGPCSTNCQLCTNSSTCQLCASNYFLNERNECSPCQYPCKTCLNANSCLSCLDQFYILENECIRCTNSCINCLNESICLSCIDGYYIQDSKCQQCPKNCLQCNTDECIECSLNTKLMNKMCIDCSDPKNKLIADCKYSNCGDHLWTPGEECDNNDQYGCQHCLIQSGYYCVNKIGEESQCLKCQNNCKYCEKQHGCDECLDGYYLNDDRQCQTCDSKCFTCVTRSDNCTKCRFRIPKIKVTECYNCEQYPGYYSDFSKHICQTQCGDSITTCNEQCDDGNILNGDGCSSTCQIEQGYICWHSNCDTILQGDMLSKEIMNPIDNQSRKYSLKYNTKILPPFFEVIPLISFSHCNINQSNIVINQTSKIVDQRDERMVDILIMFEEDCINEKMNVQLVQQKKDSSEPFLLKLFTFQIVDVILITQLRQLFNEIIFQFNQTLLYILALVCILAVLTGTIEIIYNLIDVLQLISYLKYINTHFPYNLSVYFNIFKFAQLQFFQTLTQSLIDHFISLQDLNSSVIPDQIRQDGYYPYCLLNYPTIIILILIACFLPPLTKLIQNGLERITFNYDFDREEPFILKIKLLIMYLRSYLITACYTFHTTFFSSGLISTHQILTYDILFVSFLNCYDLQFDQTNFIILISSIFSMLIIIAHCISIIFYYSQLSHKPMSLVQRSNIDKFGSLYEGLILSTQNNTHYYKLLVLIKKTVFMILIIFGVKFPLLQGISIAIICLLQVLYLLLRRPIIDKIEQWKQLTSELCVMVISVLLSVLIFDDDIHYLSNFIRDLIGWCSIGIMTFLILSQLLFDIKQQFQYYSTKCKFVKEIFKILRSQTFNGENPQNQSNHPSVILFY